MKIQVAQIHNKGDFNKEYVTLRVKESCDIGRFLLCDSTYLPDARVSNKLRHTYWFPDQQVNKGDVVYLFTGTGNNVSQTPVQGEPTKHYFYWGLKTAIWNDKNDCAVLIEANTWSFAAAA